LQAGRESSSPSGGRGFFTVEIIPKAVFLVSENQEVTVRKVRHNLKKDSLISIIRFLWLTALVNDKTMVNCDGC
jgi:hypothetical protein